MLEKIAEILNEFRGKKAHVRCFPHTVNLTAKGVLKPFEPAKPKPAEANSAETTAGDRVPLDDSGLEELYAELRDIEANGEQEKDDEEGFVEVLNEMSEAEREQWNKDVQPVRNALNKVSQPAQSAHSKRT